MQLLEAELAKEAGPGWGSSGRQFLYPTVDIWEFHMLQSTRGFHTGRSGDHKSDGLGSSDQTTYLCPENLG